MVLALRCPCCLKGLGPGAEVVSPNTFMGVPSQRAKPPFLMQSKASIVLV